MTFTLKTNLCDERWFLMAHSTIDTLLHHTSIRQFKDTPIAPATLHTLEEVAQHTASSQYMQQFTLIRVTDPRMRQQIADLTTHQYIAGPGAFYVFVVDQARNVHLAENLHAATARLTDWNAFLAGVFDAALAAQNMVAAAENEGLGTVYLGSILNDPQQMIDLLHLPRYTFPLLGLMIGIPDQAPAAKPRLPQALVVGENGYPQPPDTPKLWDTYNHTVHTYYDQRSLNARETDFARMVVANSQGDAHHRGAIGRILKQQGFSLPQ